MKTLINILLLGLSLSLVSYSTADAQVLKTRNREYKKAYHQKVKELKKKKYLSKGTGNVELSIKKAFNKEYELDDKGEQKYVVVYTSAVDPSFEGAVNACRAAARAAMAGNIETNVAELVKRSLNTQQISMKSANGINNTVTAGKQLIAQKVSIEDIYVLYREIKDERDGKTLIEVEYAACYSKRFALQRAGDLIREELKEETEELHKDLDKIFKLD